MEYRRSRDEKRTGGRLRCFLGVWPVFPLSGENGPFCGKEADAEECCRVAALSVAGTGVTAHGAGIVTSGLFDSRCIPAHTAYGCQQCWPPQIPITAFSLGESGVMVTVQFVVSPLVVGWTSVTIPPM